MESIFSASTQSEARSRPVQRWGCFWLPKIVCRSLSTRDTKLEAKIKFNLGNVFYASALQETSNPLEAIALLKAAIGHYRDALEVEPQDDDGRVNIELAVRLIEDLRERLKQRHEERQDQQERSQDEEQDGPDEQNHGDQHGEQKEVGADESQAKRQAGEHMTSQEIQRLLQGVRDRERQRRLELARRQHAKRIPVAKNW